MTHTADAPRRLPLGAVLAAALLGAVALVGGTLDQPKPAAIVTQQVPVQGATAVCPDLRQFHDELASRVSVGAAPLAEGETSSTGAIRQHANATPTSLQRVPLTAPGQVAIGLGTTLNGDALVLGATGSFSAGLEAE
ncbi:MAG: hypothetical protein JWO12_3193, partial [Frankiales bacterium]|nr:hypothetical protein [Frankiales bacterium]